VRLEGWRAFRSALRCRKGFENAELSSVSTSVGSAQRLSVEQLAASDQHRHLLPTESLDRFAIRRVTFFPLAQLCALLGDERPVPCRSRQPAA
jgi:hypothetical protein